MFIRDGFVRNGKEIFTWWTFSFIRFHETGAKLSMSFETERWYEDESSETGFTYCATAARSSGYMLITQRLVDQTYRYLDIKRGRLSNDNTRRYIYAWVRHIPACQDEPTYVDISFEFNQLEGETDTIYKQEAIKFAKQVLGRFVDEYNKKHKSKYTYTLGFAKGFGSQAY